MFSITFCWFSFKRHIYKQERLSHIKSNILIFIFFFFKFTCSETSEIKNIRETYNGKPFYPFGSFFLLTGFSVDNSHKQWFKLFSEQTYVYYWLPNINGSKTGIECLKAKRFLTVVWLKGENSSFLITKKKECKEKITSSMITENER